MVVGGFMGSVGGWWWWLVGGGGSWWVVCKLILVFSLNQSISSLLIKGSHQNISTKKLGKILNFNLGIFETQGGLNFSEISDFYMALRPHPRNKNKTLNLALFIVNICINMPFEMTVRGSLPFILMGPLTYIEGEIDFYC